jgi:hypothetical protein
VQNCRTQGSFLPLPFFLLHQFGKHITFTCEYSRKLIEIVFAKWLDDKISVLLKERYLLPCLALNPNFFRNFLGISTWPFDVNVEVSIFFRMFRKDTIISPFLKLPLLLIQLKNLCPHKDFFCLALSH